MKLNWTKIRNEYINGHISYRKLAEKHGISASNLMERAAKEKWFEKRKEQRIKIQAKTEQKTVEKIAEKESDLAANIYSAAEKLLEKIQLATEQLDKCFIGEKRKYTRQVIDPETQKKIYVDIEEERIKEDTKAEPHINKGELKKLTSALKDLQSIQLAGKGEAEHESPNINITICPAQPIEEEGEDE